MYECSTTVSISAAHRLALSYDSPCERWHGHNWKIKVTVQSEGLNDDGMVIDFSEIKKIVRQLDHTALNDVLGALNPTAENIAAWVNDKVDEVLGKTGTRVVRVDVEETEGNCASYISD